MAFVKAKVTEKEAARAWFETHPDYWCAEEKQTLGCAKHGFLPRWGKPDEVRALPSIEKDGSFGEPAKGKPDPECFDCMLALTYQTPDVQFLCRAVGMLSEQVKHLKEVVAAQGGA